jgi:hypothetical protein
MSGGSSGQQVQNTSSTSTSGPHPAVAPKLEHIKEGFWSWYQNHANAPAYYPGGTVAALSPETQQSISSLFSRGANKSPMQNASEQNALSVLRGDYLDLSRNPYFQSALTAGFEPQTRNFMNNILPSVAGQFSGAGRYGSGSQMNVTQMALDSLNREQANAAATASNAAYAQERQNQMAALGLLPSFQAADYQNLAAMQQAGALKDAYAQRLKDDANAKYSYDATAQADWLQRAAQMIQSIYPGGTTSGSSTTWGMSAPPSNAGAQLGSAAITAAGTAAAAFF